MWEGVGDRTKTAIYWPHSYGHQRCVFLVLLMLNRRPGGSAFCWVLAFSTTSCHQRVSKTTGGLEGPLGRVGAFPTTSYQQLLWTPTDRLPALAELYNSSRPLNRPLNLWNGMFDRHQAEIAVMQFRGHSLPMHQSMSVPWEFYLVPFHQPNLPTRSISITGHWNVSLPSGASFWNGKFGRVEGQNTTLSQLLHLRFLKIIFTSLTSQYLHILRIKSLNTKCFSDNLY